LIPLDEFILVVIGAPTELDVSKSHCSVSVSGTGGGGVAGGSITGAGDTTG
jgi:hypothetical protein